MTFLSRIIYENRNLKLFSDGVDIKLFVLLFGITLLFVLPTAKLFGTYFHRKSVVCTLYTDTASKTVRLLMDTGNILKDPYTDKPVVIIKKDILDDLLGKNGVHRCYNECNDKMALESRLRFINAKTVSGCVLLPVIGAVKISAYKADGKPRELFAVVAADVSDENDYDGNDGVIPYMLESSF